MIPELIDATMVAGARDEEPEVLELISTPEFGGRSPNLRVPMLANMGLYVASESTMYRILRRHRMLHR